MKLPHMTRMQELVFAAAFSREMLHGRSRGSVDNSAAEEALEHALWEVECFKQAVRERKG